MPLHLIESLILFNRNLLYSINQFSDLGSGTCVSDPCTVIYKFTKQLRVIGVITNVAQPLFERIERWRFLDDVFRSTA